jgi:glutamate/tyrosine decarboxylase-like PLP-dependent enzyme
MADEQVQTSAEQAAQTGESASLLDQIVEASKLKPSDEGFAATKAGLQAFLTQLVQTGGEAKVSGAQVDDMLAEIDRKLSAQVNAIMHNDQFQKLESSWRSLKFLVDRTDFRQNIKVEFMNVSKEDLLSDFEDSMEVVKSGLYKQIYTAEYGQFGGQPIGAMVANYDFGPGPQDIQLLQYVASAATMAHAPFVAAAGKEFFGIDSWEQLPNLKDLHSIFENEVIDFFAPHYGFKKDDTWGIVTYSGTDGNNHGVYFGVKYLLSLSKLKPVLYVSEEAHYSIKKLGDLQNLDMRLIRADIKGRMDIQAFEKQLDPKRPALIVIAMGTTFKGGIDDQKAIDEVLKRKKPVAVYRHLDAALFGGFLPFSEHRALVDRTRYNFDSIAVSGHKFFGFDEPLGLFITTKDVLSRQNPFRVPYLNDAVPTITCSRSSLGPLKFWWKVQKTGVEGYRQQAAQILKNADYLKQRLDAIKYPAWKNDFSNTVYFRRPSAWVMKKWDLAPDEDPRLGGELAHDIVMQHEGPDTIDLFVADMRKSQQELAQKN